MSASTMQKALMRQGDFHLRRDARQMFGNYVELSPVGGQAITGSPAVNFERVRKSAMVAASPVYDEPQLWGMELLFSAPYGTASPPAPATFPPVAPSPWVPSGFNFDVVVTIIAALDRDKQTSTETFTLEPLDANAVGVPTTFPPRFRHAHQLSLSVALVGTTSEVLGVQGSIWPVNSGDRDAFGSDAITEFAQSNGSQLFLAPNARRRQFLVCNLGDAALYVGFADEVNLPTGSPPHNLTFVLPAGDVYESPRDCWQGAVAGVWAASSVDPTKFATVTEAT